MSDFVSLTDEVLKAEREVERLDKLLSDAKSVQRRCEQEVLQAMIMGTIPTKFNAHGRTWNYDSTISITPASKEYTDIVCEWIKNNGGEDLVKPSMHAASRDKFLREHFIDEDGDVTELPDELKDCVKVDSFAKLRRRTVQ